MQWAAPRVRTASWGVPIGRNPSVRAACACACAVLCDWLSSPQFETRFVGLVPGAGGECTKTGVRRPLHSSGRRRECAQPPGACPSDGVRARARHALVRVPCYAIRCACRLRDRVLALRWKQTHQCINICPGRPLCAALRRRECAPRGAQPPGACPMGGIRARAPHALVSAPCCAIRCACCL